MKWILSISFFLFAATVLFGQQRTLEKGAVSHVSSRNVYVKFSTTEHINIGDTLFLQISDQFVPAIIINNKSSTSCVGTPLTLEPIKVQTVIFARRFIKEEEKPVEGIQDDLPFGKTKPIPEEKVTSEVEKKAGKFDRKQKIKGRISASSYSNFSDYKDSHRMRYSFSFRGNNLKNSRFSTDSYITFRHTANEWNEVKENLSRALKVYTLSVKYDIDSTSSLIFGRKINPKISSLGAIDGIQYEKGLGNFILGAVAGSRPDYSDYGLNPNLLQAGAYISYVSQNPKSYQQSTLGFIEQRNTGKTDRRFVYFQHSGSVSKNANLFASFEMDLFENINNEVKNTLRLTNMYVSLRYKVSKKWRLSASYDNRNNIIYYESYKNFIDQLIEDETRQGLRFGINYRPLKYLTWGLTSNFRFQKSNSNISRNINSYVNISRIPVINARASFRFNYLQTGYLDSQTYGIRLSKEIIRGRLNGDLYFRHVDYQYKNSSSGVNQNISGINFSLKLYKSLSLYVYYEGTFDSSNQKYHRFNTKIIHRF